jgi:hypothetical protein
MPIVSPLQPSGEAGLKSHFDRIVQARVLKSAESSLLGAMLPNMTRPKRRSRLLYIKGVIQ